MTLPPVGHNKRAATGRVNWERPDQSGGAGLIGSVSGLLVFLLLMLLATQVIVHLYATSVVTAVGYDTARSVAASGAPGVAKGGSIALAEAEARKQLGGLGKRAKFDWSGTNDDVVHLRIVVDRRGRSAFSLARPVPERIERTIVVRVERFR